MESPLLYIRLEVCNELLGFAGRSAMSKQERQRVLLFECSVGVVLPISHLRRQSVDFFAAAVQERLRLPVARAGPLVERQLLAA